jgi:hypothetical protein
MGPRSGKYAFMYANTFEQLAENGTLIADKSLFIKEMWNSRFYKTLITSPMGTGKTMMATMLNDFFEKKPHGDDKTLELFKKWA